jgi:DoxX-like family
MMANIALWTLQVLLALHTLIGAGWKISNPEQTVPSLAAIPHSVWIGFIGFEALCAFGLVIPALLPSLGILAPVAAAGIALEMLGFVWVHQQSGVGSPGEIAYWLGVAVICGLIVAGRIWVRPL